MMRKSITSGSWHQIVSQHIKLGENAKALELYDKLQFCINPTQHQLLCVLKACSGLRALQQGRAAHAQCIENGFETVAVIGNTLIDMYAKCGAFEEAQKLFNGMSRISTVSWSIMIAGYTQLGDGSEAIEVFQRMQSKGATPSKVTFLNTLKACGKLGATLEGMLIHDQIMRAELDLDMMVSSSLIDMYAKCGTLAEACKVFMKLQKKDVVAWNALMLAYADHGQGHCTLHCFEVMQNSGVGPTKGTMRCILKACGSEQKIEQGRIIHAHLIENGWISDDAIGGALIDMYIYCKRMHDACRVLEQSGTQSVVTWGIIITGFSEHGYGFSALELFEMMQQRSLMADKFIYLGALKACHSTETVRYGWMIHDQIIRNNEEKDMVIASALIDMHAKNGSLEEARALFDRLSNRNEVSWGAMIAGYVQYGHSTCALQLYKIMLLEGISPSRAIFLSTLKACGSICDIRQGRLVHCDIMICCPYVDQMTESTILDMYIKCGVVNEAYYYFTSLPARETVSWNAMMVGCVQCGRDAFALSIFEDMLHRWVEPDKYTFSCILQACGSLGATQVGTWIHSMATKYGLCLDTIVGGTLVDMYARCGSLKEAQKAFNCLPDKDVASWGALIAGYAEAGDFTMVVKCFCEMRDIGLSPDEKTFSSILAACSHAGEVEEGYKYFESMTKEFGITPSVVHFNCMLDLLSRSGRANEARKMIETMPLSPDITGGLTLITACRNYGILELGQHYFNNIVHMDRTLGSGYMLMSNIYADCNMWEQAFTIQDSRKCAGAWKKPASAWTEINHKVYEFNLVNNIINNDIDVKWGRLERVMKHSGLILHLDLVLKQFPVVQSTHTWSMAIL